MLMSVARPGAVATMGMRGTVGRRGGGVARVMLFEEIRSGEVRGLEWMGVVSGLRVHLVHSYLGSIFLY